MAGRVDGKAALVTGGASGLGAESARLLAAEGARVCLADVRDALAEEVAGEIRAAGGEAFALRHDVTSEAEWQAAVDAVVARWGGLHILLNAAGVAGGGQSIAETSLEEWRRVQPVNLDGTFLGVKHAMAAMAEGEGGGIVDISSILGLIGLPKTAAHAASKCGVKLPTKAAAVECARFGMPVRVNSIHPGFIDTPMVQNRLQSPDGDRLARLIETTQGALGRPSDIAEGVLYLASDASRFVTGAELVIDGGMTAH